LRLSVDDQILPCIKARTMDFAGKKAPRDIELKPAEEQHLPTKFQEKITEQIRLGEPLTDGIGQRAQDAIANADTVDKLAADIGASLEISRPATIAEQKFTPEQIAEITSPDAMSFTDFAKHTSSQQDADSSTQAATPTSKLSISLPDFLSAQGSAPRDE
jgi:hypothetical protein